MVPRFLLSGFFSCIAAALIAQQPLRPKAPVDQIEATGTAHQLQKDPAPKKQRDPLDLISINPSGDAAIHLPLHTARGRTLVLPIAIDYWAGIKVHQKASDIGLGWTLQFGSITRDYGAFEPDYTSTGAETEMNSSHPNVTAGDLTVVDPEMPLATGELKPLANNKNLRYEGVEAGNLSPDNYLLNVPGLGSNTFWNAGSKDQALRFQWSNTCTWKLDYAVKTFSIQQEFSAVNDANLQLSFPNGPSQPPNGLLLGGTASQNFAAAIGLLPYVKNRYFRKYVVDPRASTRTFNPVQEMVRYEDFASFTITDGDGVQYVFGRPLRGQKYLIEEDPFWSTVQNADARGNQALNTNASYGEFWKTDYIAEWLLTEIRSPDYQDLNKDGIAGDGDAGDWIRIDYTEAYERKAMQGFGTMALPKYREWSNLSQTDQASSLMRERAYVQSITTPTERIDFSISKRFEVDQDYFSKILNTGMAGRPVGEYSYNLGNLLKVNYPVETQKYDQFSVRDRMSNQILRTYNFLYAEKGSPQELAVSNYLIRNNADVETVSLNPDLTGDPAAGGFSANAYFQSYGRGKTTLKGIRITPDPLLSVEALNYTFDYDYNPSYSEIHKHEIEKAFRSPSLRLGCVTWPRNEWRGFNYAEQPYQSSEYRYTGSASPQKAIYVHAGLQVDEMGNFYEPTAPNQGRHAWSLSRLTVPEGGVLELEYENDSCDYAQDRQGWLSRPGLCDDRYPAIAQYNAVAIARSLVQCNVSNQNTSCPGSTESKRLYRTFEYSMNATSGGLRLKRKTARDGVQAPVVVAYNYGKGHYPSVPATYWQNCISAFSSFMKMEKLRHDGELYKESLAAAMGQLSDFAYYMSRYASNIRIDNTVNDAHYYEYIEEKRMDGTRTRYTYGDPASGDPALPFYQHQSSGRIKGHLKPDFVEVIANSVQDPDHETALLKTEQYAADGTRVGVEHYRYFTLYGPQNNLSTLAYTPIEQPAYASYACINSGGDKYTQESSAPNILKTSRLLDARNPSYTLDQVAASATQQMVNVSPVPGNKVGYNQVQDDNYRFPALAIRRQLNSLRYVQSETYKHCGES